MLDSESGNDTKFNFYNVSAPDVTCQVHSNPREFAPQVHVTFEINLSIEQTQKHYDQMKYKEALKTGFFEFQSIRDKYRELEMERMHRGLVFRFIDVQTLMLSPICPHLCEYIWGLLGKRDSIMRASWPEVGPYEQILVQSSEYLMDAAHNFRKRLKAYTATGKGKKVVPPPTHATIWIAKTYPPWQNTILTTVKTMYEEINDMPDNKAIAAALGKKPELKKYMKKAMPFVMVVKENCDKHGLAALNLTVEYDEWEILNTNLKYFVNTLEMEAVSVRYTDEADDKVKEECCPGKPFVTFWTAQSVPIKFINPQPYSGLFEVIVPIFKDDTMDRVKARLMKTDRSKMKDVSQIKLMLFDSLESERRLPELDSHEKGKTILSNNVTFSWEHETDLEVCIGENGRSVMASRVIYIVCQS